MAVTQDTKKIHTGNGSNESFDFPFYAEGSDNLVVTHTDSDGTETTLVYDTDYTATGFGAEQTGQVSFPKAGSSYSTLAADEKLTCSLDESFTQDREFKNKTKYYPVEHGKALDKLTRMCKQNKEELDRAVKIGISSSENPDDIIDDIKASETAAAASAAAAASDEADAEAHKDAAAAAQAAAETARDESQAAVNGVKVSSNDTTPKPLADKLVAGTNVSLDETDDGSDETLVVNVTVPTVTKSWGMYDGSNDQSGWSGVDVPYGDNYVKSANLQDGVCVFAVNDAGANNTQVFAILDDGTTTTVGDFEDTGMDHDNISGEGGYTIQRISDTKFVVAGRTGSGSGYDIILAVGEVNTSTGEITMGAVQTYTDAGLIRNVIAASIDDSNFLLGFCAGAGAGSINAKAVVCNVDGSNAVTVNTPVTFETGLSFYNPMGMHYFDDDCILTALRPYNNTTQAAIGSKLTRSGNTLTDGGTKNLDNLYGIPSQTTDWGLYSNLMVGSPITGGDDKYATFTLSNYETSPTENPSKLYICHYTLATYGAGDALYWSNVELQQGIFGAGYDGGMAHARSHDDMSYMIYHYQDNYESSAPNMVGPQQLMKAWPTGFAQEIQMNLNAAIGFLSRTSMVLFRINPENTSLNDADYKVIRV